MPLQGDMPTQNLKDSSSWMCLEKCFLAVSKCRVRGLKGIIERAGMLSRIGNMSGVGDGTSPCSSCSDSFCSGGGFLGPYCTVCGGI